jgi:hypothetical protein
MTFVLRVAILHQLILKDMNCIMSGESHGKPIIKGSHRSIDHTVPTYKVGGDKT